MKARVLQLLAAIARLAEIVVEFVSENRADVALIGGVASIAFGFALAWLPLGFIVGGSIAVAIALAAGGDE